MKLDLGQLVIVGQAINACYAPFFLDRPERAALTVGGIPHDVIWGEDADGPRPYGAIYYEPRLGAWIVAIRGTDSFPEWIADATAFLVDCPFLPGTRTHKGFTGIYESLRVDGVDIRAHCAPMDRPIIVAGHSLGAALATLTAAAIGGVDLVTFAGPQVGDDAFAHRAMTRLASNSRIVCQSDLVPKLPVRLDPDFLYAPLGLPIPVEMTGIVDDPRQWHDLNNYLRFLDPRPPVEPTAAAPA